MDQQSSQQDEGKLLLTERSALLEYLSKVLQGNMTTGRHSALLVLSVRQYNTIYVNYGYDAARRSLKDLQRRIVANLPQKEAVFFLGGNEFAITLTEIKVVHLVKLAISKILKLLEREFAIADTRISIKVNIGAVFSEQMEGDAEKMLQQAYSAMLDAQEHKQVWAFYREQEASVEVSGLEIQTHLEKALAANELTTVFQPKTNMQTGELVGAETLSRWNSPVLGFVSPDLFIDAAEKSGLINDLTMRTIRSAALQYMQWGDYSTNIAVNLSAGIITQPNLIALILRSLKTWSMPPEALTLEITETDVMKSPEKSLAVLREISKHGIRLSIDDFGTGYSSLSYLKMLPVNELKIDKSFIHQLTTDESDRKIVKAIVDLAHTFDLKIVAEGIEDEATYRILRGFGCETAQGYLVSRPLAPDDFLAWHRKNDWFRVTDDIVEVGNGVQRGAA